MFTEDEMGGACRMHGMTSRKHTTKDTGVDERLILKQRPTLEKD
jgi:hypothetical protein